MGDIRGYKAVTKGDVAPPAGASRALAPLRRSEGYFLQYKILQQEQTESRSIAAMPRAARSSEGIGSEADGVGSSSSAARSSVSAAARVHWKR